MILSTEIFVFIVFLIALPVFIFLFRSAKIPSSGYFLTAFVCLLASNIFTVAEMWFFSHIFNLLEHLSIALSSVFFFWALRGFLIARTNPGEHSTGRLHR